MEKSNIYFALKTYSNILNKLSGMDALIEDAIYLFDVCSHSYYQP
jgi:hypothetical protein